MSLRSSNRLSPQINVKCDLQPWIEPVTKNLKRVRSTFRSYRSLTDFWRQVRLGDEPMTDNSRLNVLKQREIAALNYKYAKRKKPDPEREQGRINTEREGQRSWRRANQVRLFEMWPYMKKILFWIISTPGHRPADAVVKTSLSTSCSSRVRFPCRSNPTQFRPRLPRFFGPVLSRR